MKKAKKDPQEKNIEEIGQLKAQLARALADYDNLRKRTDEEKKVWISFASQRVLERLLPILDMFDLSLSHTKDPGLAIAVSEFKSVLKDEGLEEIKPEVGNEFNHDTMEAIDTVEGEEQNLDNTVAEVLSLGWKFTGGAVVRHAKVKVYKKSLLTTN